MTAHRILIVEDHPDIRSLVRMTLEFERFEIHEAGNAEEALPLLAALVPDLVIVDVMMNGVTDGFQLCRYIKRTPALAHIAVILLTSRAQIADVQAGQSAGADAYVVKPFSPLDLINRANHLLNARLSNP